MTDTCVDPETLPACRPYHPLSSFIGCSGYYPSLTAGHMASMTQLDDLIAAAELDIVTDVEDLFLKKLRFLRARQFNAQKAFDMLENDCKMRRDHTRAGLMHVTAESVLQCDLTQVYNYFPSWVQGFDKEGRPVAYRNFGAKFEIWNILKITSMENLIRFHAWEGEQAVRIMNERSAASGYNIETFVVIIDASGWHTGLATSDAFTYIKAMANTDSDHYPERLGRLLVINAPFALSFAWRIIKRFLDDVTRKKIEILSSLSNWQPVMQSFIDISEIPEMYGGTLPDPTPEEAINSINPPVKDIHPLSAEERSCDEQQKKKEASEFSKTAQSDGLCKEFDEMLREEDEEAVVPPLPPKTEESAGGSDA